MKLKNIAFLFIVLFGCRESSDTPFGKEYNVVRIKYGSPIIHDYMEKRIGSNILEYWTAPKEMHDNATTGFHAEKGFHIIQDSILQEDDIFRKRIDDSTFVFIGILTYGNLNEHKFMSIYYDTLDLRRYSNNDKNHLKYYRQKEKMSLTIDQADSILNLWGTSRTK